MSSTTSQVSVDSVDGLHCLWRRPGVYCPAERAKRKCPIDNICGSTKVPAASAKRGSTLRTARKGDHMKFGSRQTILGATGILMVCLVGVAMLSGQAAQEPKPQMGKVCRRHRPEAEFPQKAADGECPQQGQLRGNTLGDVLDLPSRRPAPQGRAESGCAVQCACGRSK